MDVVVADLHLDLGLMGIRVDMVIVVGEGGFADLTVGGGWDDRGQDLIFSIAPV